MDDDKPSKFNIYGRSINKVPCFKESFTGGILCGLGVGVGHFMLTSRVRRSSDMGMLTFTVVTLCYWFYCRYTFSKNKFYCSQIKNAVQKTILTEGTNNDPRATTED